MNCVPCLLILMGFAFGFVSSAMTFTKIDPVFGLYELTDTITIISSLECALENRTDIDYKASLGSSSDCQGCFQVYPKLHCASGADFCLKYLPVQTLNYETNKVYKISVTCEALDDDTIQATEVVEIRLIPNTPPTFNSLATVPVDVRTTKDVDAGQLIYTVLCTDPDSDALTYDITEVDPTFAREFFYIDTEGSIRAVKALRSACFSAVNFKVTCSDRRHDPVGPLHINVNLLGANEEPMVIGLDFNKDIPEDELVGTTLAVLTVTDEDATTCRLSTNPLNSLQYFELDTSNTRVTVRTKLDYEQVATRNANLTVTCSDGYCTSESHYIYVRVTDVNEPVELTPVEVKGSTYEGNIVFDPKWQPIDPDIDDDLIYTIIGGTGNDYFSIDTDTGILRSTIEYDVDDGSLEPKSVTVIVQVRDEAGHTDTSTVSLSILDYNDNAPVFTVSSQSFVITDCVSTVGTIIGTAVSATDRDSSLDGNNDIVYSTSSNGAFTVVNNGDVAVSGAVTAGSTYTVQIVASDKGTGPGGSKRSDPHATVTVFVRECVTTTPPPPTTAAPTVTAGPTASPATTTTTTKRPTVDDLENSSESLDSNLGWIIFAGLLATVFLAALGFMLWRYFGQCATLCAGGGFGPRGACSGFCDCGDCCTPRPPPRAVVPVRGPQPPNGNPGFWQERYPDDDYIEQPDRDRIPTPAPMEGSHSLALEPSNSWRHSQPHRYY